MDKIKNVVNNTMISLLGQGVTWVSTLLLTIAYGRFLGDVKFGELYFAITFVQLIGFPIEFGFNQQVTRDVAQEPAKASRYLANTLLIKFIVWLFLFSLLLLICWLLGYNSEEQLLVGICGLTLLSTAITTAFNSLHYSFQRVIFPVVGSILEKGLGALVGIILLRLGYGVEIMALVLLGGSVIDAGWQAFWFFRLLGLHVALDRAIIRNLLHTGIPFLVYGVLGVIYYRIDTVLLSLLAPVAVVGWYGAAYKLFDTLLFLPSLFISAIMYPVFSKLTISSPKDLKLAVEKTTNFLLLCAMPIATLLIVSAAGIIGFLYHNAQFAESIPVLQALAPGLVFLYVNSVFGSILMSSRREKKMVLMAAMALVFNVGLNLLLIPVYRQVGAAVVTSLTELLLLILSALFVPRNLIPVKSLITAGKILAACLAMAAAAWFLQTKPIFVVIPVAGCIYLIGILLVRAIPREDILAVYRVIRYRTRKESVEPLAQVALEEQETLI
jgi:O-antigen/teichoic acid export membrane protein